MADFANNNNPANVSTTRGIVGGYFLMAPIGTTDLPTDANFTNWVPTNAWTNLGYIPEDGFTEGVEFGDAAELRDINLDSVDVSTGAATETLQVALMEMNERALALVYGASNVSDSSGVITAEHNWGDPGSYMFVLRLLLKNGRKWVKLIRNAKVTAVGEFTGNATTAAQRQVTLTYSKDGSGNAGCVDYIESNDTSAGTVYDGRLASLTIGTLPLVPSFSAGEFNYTLATTNASDRVTAAPVTAGATIAIDNGGTTVTNGNAASWSTGTNTLTITCTDNTDVKTYTVIVTKS